jgi:hypothetical protein
MSDIHFDQLCLNYLVRREACVCLECHDEEASPEVKHDVNKRDVRALLALISDCLDGHPDLLVDKTPWAKAPGGLGGMARLREKLMEIALDLALAGGGVEAATRRHIEEALCAADDDVGVALIESLA